MHIIPLNGRAQTRIQMTNLTCVGVGIHWRIEGGAKGALPPPKIG